MIEVFHFYEHLHCKKCTYFFII